MSWLGKNKGGSGGADTVARNQAQDLANKLAEILKSPGDTVTAGEEVFVKLASGKVLNYKNPTSGTLTIPAAGTDAAIKAAGFTGLGSAITQDEIIAAWETKRTAWSADGGSVNFSTSEPAKIAGNVGKIYFNTTTGNGFNANSLYKLNSDLTWREYPPQEGWILTVGADKYVYGGTSWKPDLKSDHLHVYVGDANTSTYYAFGKNKFWTNKVATPNFAIKPGEAGWTDNWQEVTQATSEIGKGSALPADNTSFSFFNLLGHATIPNGFFYWDTGATTWVQV